MFARTFVFTLHKFESKATLSSRERSICILDHSREVQQGALWRAARLFVHQTSTLKILRRILMSQLSGVEDMLFLCCGRLVSGFVTRAHSVVFGGNRNMYMGGVQLLHG